MLKSGNIIDTENSRSRNNVFENVKLNTLYIVFCFSTQETDIVEVVDTTALIPAQATTHYIEIYYSGVYVTANFDSQGRIIYAKNYMEVQQMRGSGSMLGFTMTVEGHGDFYGEYTITY